jgi:TM2 domain-containing membrane protein YozV/RNA polymerase subunit RPABC4/transcription elongation factor Spt4
MDIKKCIFKNIFCIHKVPGGLKMEDYSANLDISEDEKKATAKKTSMEQPRTEVNASDSIPPKASQKSTESSETLGQATGAKFCVNCGSSIDRNASICPKCGVAQSKNPKEKSTKFCTNCGSEIDSKAEICPRCGVRQPGIMGFSGEKNPAIAALLSFLVVGLGQVYAGKPKRGIVLFAACVIFAMTSFLVLPVFAALACWIGSIYDAYKIAQGEPGPFSFIDNYTNEL